MRIFKKAFILIFIFLIPITVFAVEGGTGGESGDTATCNSAAGDLCYASQGLRFSIYKYDSDTNALALLRTIDYSLTGEVNHPLTTLGTVKTLRSTPTGKFTYINNNFSEGRGSSTSVDGYYTSSMNLSTLPTLENEFTIPASRDKCYITTSCSDFKSNLLVGILSNFKITISGGTMSTTATSSEMASILNNIFYEGNNNIAEADLQNIYLTIEPTLAIKRYSTYYYGSAYEMALLKGNFSATNLTNVNNLVKKQLQHSIKISNVYGSVPAAIKNKYGISVVGAANPSGISDVKSKGYGINVLWFGAIFRSCRATCGTGQSDAQLKCYENYCESFYGSSKGGNTATKKDCIVNKCGYTASENLCGSGETCTDYDRTTSDSICDDGVVKNYKTCIHPDVYTKILCNDTANKYNVKYSNDLPTSFLKNLGGFNYSLKIDATRSCVATFNYKLAKLNFAAATGAAEKTAAHASISTSYSRYSKIGTTNTYESGWKATVEGDTTVEFSVNGERYTDWSVYAPNPTTDTTKTDSGYKVRFYSNNSEAFTAIDVDNIKTLSSGNAIYNLQTRCYTLVNGRKNSIVDAECRDIKSNPFYYGYYSKNGEAIINTETTISSDSMCFENTNTCYYTNIETSVDCHTKTVFNTSTSKYKVSFYVDGYKGQTVEYSFDDRTGVYTGDNILEKEYTPQSTVQKKIAYIEYEDSGSTITKYCNYYIPKTSSPNDKTCKLIYKEDKCKNANEIQRYCRDNWYKDETKYESATDCIKDCVCLPPNTPSYKYTYRPISLSNPFPDREAGDNWVGHEDIARRNNFDQTPIYVIVLDKENIKTIKNDTNNNKSKYISYGDFSRDDTNTYNSYYYSNLVHTNSEIFKCINGTGDCE